METIKLSQIWDDLIEDSRLGPKFRLYLQADKYYKVDIEPELIKYSKFLVKEIKERTMKDIPDESMRAGILGQTIFHYILLAYKVPHVYADPLLGNQFAFRKYFGKHFDVFIPNIGFLSVKTASEGENRIRVLIPVEEWHNEQHDYLIAMKIENEAQNEARFYGWLKAEEVEALPKYRGPETGYKEVYWTYLDPELARENREYDIDFKASSMLKPLCNPAMFIRQILKQSLVFHKWQKKNLTSGL